MPWRAPVLVPLDRMHRETLRKKLGSEHLHTSAYVSIRTHTHAACISIRMHRDCVIRHAIRQHPSVYACSIRQRMHLDCVIRDV